MLRTAALAVDVPTDAGTRRTAAAATAMATTNLDTARMKETPCRVLGNRPPDTPKMSSTVDGNTCRRIIAEKTRVTAVG